MPHVFVTLVVSTYQKFRYDRKLINVFFIKLVYYAVRIHILYNHIHGV